LLKPKHISGFNFAEEKNWFEANRVHSRTGKFICLHKYFSSQGPF
jgi:hypothetical protein